MKQRQHSQVRRCRSQQCSDDLHLAGGKRTTLSFVMSLRPRATAPSTARMMSADAATQSETAGKKNPATPANDVMKLKAMVLLLNMLFMVLYFIVFQ